MPSLRASLQAAFAVVLAAAGAACAASPESFTGRCVGVTDGDTISVMRDGRAVTVRLEGIDAPERGQDFSNRAKQMASILTFGKDVTVQVTGTDKYQRILGRVSAEGLDVNVELVRVGLAWHFKEYSDDPVLAAAERDARQYKRGLWVVAHPMPPWEYRRVGPAPSTAQGIVSAPPAAPRSAPPSGIVYHGNQRSHVFHRPGCQHYYCSNCVVPFSSREAAIAAGYRPCGSCRP